MSWSCRKRPKVGCSMKGLNVPRSSQVSIIPIVTKKPALMRGPALGGRAQLGMARSEVRTGEHGGEEELTEALVAPCPVEERYGLPEAVNRPTIVALGTVGHTEGLVRQRLQDDLPADRGERKGALASGDGLVSRAHEVEMA